MATREEFEKLLEEYTLEIAQKTWDAAWTEFCNKFFWNEEE